MTTLLKMAFDLMPAAGSTRAFSATDLKVRLPVQVANPRALTSALKSRGLITQAFRQGGQAFFVKTAGALVPVDARKEPDRLAAARLARQKKHLAKRARQAKRAKVGR